MFFVYFLFAAWDDSKIFSFSNKLWPMLICGYSAAKTTKLLRFRKPHHVHFENSHLFVYFSFHVWDDSQMFSFSNKVRPMFIPRVLCRENDSTFKFSKRDTMLILKNQVVHFSFEAWDDFKTLSFVKIGFPLTSIMSFF